MERMKTISVAAFAQHGLLRGRTTGRKAFADICAKLAETVQGQVVFIDFAGVSNVNGSWLNAAVAPIFRWAADERNDVFPILCNFPAKDLEELVLVAQINRQSYPVTEKPSSAPRSVQIVGPLDAALQKTVLAVAKRGEVTGAALGEQHSEEKIGATAWNNRLADLNRMRLVSRRKEGRRQFYRTIAPEVEFYG